MLAASLVFVAVILIIFALLVMTFRSVPEAAHVLLAVPFALTGGMLSSLVHILVVTPVIFVWLRERETADQNPTVAAERI